jgi:hypothetical protein
MLNFIGNVIKWMVYAGLTAIVLVVGLFVFLMISELSKVKGTGSSVSTATVSTTQTFDMHGYAYQTIDNLAGMLKDADSAEFRNVQVVESVGELKGMKLVVGEVNSKNSFGGYTGFQAFVGTPALVSVESQMSADEFRKFWNSEVAGGKILWKTETFFY